MIQSPYRRGADDGFIFGIYLTVMFFASILSGHLALLSVLSFVMMVSVPLVIYRFMLNYHKVLGPAGSFAMLWMHGVVIFFCGMLIAGTALVVYMRWINPDFIVNQLQQVVTLASSMPDNAQAAEIAELFSRMIEAKFIPTPMEIVTEMLMLAIVTGSLLSMTLSAVFVVKRRRSENLPNY